jgi:hypothetical protein
VTLRGISPAGLEMRDNLKLIAGRWFPAGGSRGWRIDPEAFSRARIGNTFISGAVTGT